jgi:hypothetical protein
MVATYLAVITVRNDLPAKSFAELVALAKREPGKLTCGSAGIASFGNMAGETIKLKQGIDIVHVPFKGSGDLVAGLLGGQIDVIIDGVGLPLAKSGKARALATFAEIRHPDLPEIPSLAEAGLKTGLPRTWWGIFAPEGHARADREAPDAALARILAEPETEGPDEPHQRGRLPPAAGGDAQADGRGQRDQRRADPRDQDEAGIGMQTRQDIHRFLHPQTKSRSSARPRTPASSADGSSNTFSSSAFRGPSSRSTPGRRWSGAAGGAVDQGKPATVDVAIMAVPPSSRWRWSRVRRVRRVGAHPHHGPVRRRWARKGRRQAGSASRASAACGCSVPTRLGYVNLSPAPRCRPRFRCRRSRCSRPAASAS